MVDIIDNTEDTTCNQIIVDSIKQYFSKFLKTVSKVVTMPEIYNDCGEGSNDCKIVVTDLKTDNYL